jgi:hypothetical protein
MGSFWWEVLLPKDGFSLIHTSSVNHMQAHILAHFIDEGFEKPSFPFLALTIAVDILRLFK